MHRKKDPQVSLRVFVLPAGPLRGADGKMPPLMLPGFCDKLYPKKKGKGMLRAILRRLRNKQPDDTDLFTTLSGWEEYLHHREHAGLARRESVDNNSIPSVERAPFQVEGFCYPCNATRNFSVNYFLDTHAFYTDGKSIPCWREELLCPHCNMNNRMRASLHLFGRFLAPNKDDAIYISEAVTATFGWCAAHYKCVVGSEFCGDAYAPGEIVNGIRHENIANLSFADASLGAVLSFDVLEHVPDHKKALAEIHRGLKPGGLLLLSVPFAWDYPKHIIKAEMMPDGSITHHHEPEYHGNPVDPANGSLCYRYFGWELLDDLREAGFANPEVKAYWSDKFGYHGRENYFTVARKS